MTAETITSDVLIVGGGSAGCVLAARLSAGGDLRVLLVEAGEDFHPLPPADILDAFPRAYANPAYFVTHNDARVCGTEDARPFTQARLMGGGSAVMGMWALRGLPGDYDGWGGADGVSWGFEACLPAFRRLEADRDFGGPLHGGSGPIPIFRVPRSAWPAFALDIEAAARARGIPAGEDLNGETADGVFPLPISADIAGRAASTRYLDAKVRARPNLRILDRVEVEALTLGPGPRVTGACGRRSDGSTVRFVAPRTVLSAGAIGTPLLMQRSGLGPAEVLRAAGVDVVADLAAIGRNLQNHVFLHLAAFVPPRLRHPRYLRQYVTSIVRFSSGVDGAPASDLMLSVVSRPGVHRGGASVALLGVHLNAPASRGSVELVRDPEGALVPAIDFRLLSEPLDRLRLERAAKFGQDLLADLERAGRIGDPFVMPATAPIRALNAPRQGAALRSAGLAAVAALPAGLRRAALRRLLPGVAFLDGEGQADFGDRVAAAALPMFHVAGTCAMGSALDADLGVRGVHGLHVADASAMPRLPRANTNIPTLMLAERAADLIGAASRAMGAAA